MSITSWCKHAPFALLNQTVTGSLSSLQSTKCCARGMLKQAAINKSPDQWTRAIKRETLAGGVVRLIRDTAESDCLGAHECCAHEQRAVFLVLASDPAWSKIAFVGENRRTVCGSDSLARQIGVVCRRIKGRSHQEKPLWPERWAQCGKTDRMFGNEAALENMTSFLVKIIDCKIIPGWFILRFKSSVIKRSEIKFIGKRDNLLKKIQD